MNHTHDLLRKRLLRDCGEKGGSLSLSSLRESEWSPLFEQYMRNRLVMGAFRYGLLHDKCKKQFDRVAYIKVKLDRYEQTGNLEALVDVANLALLEFEEGRHPKRHFSSLDDTEEHAKEK